MLEHLWNGWRAQYVQRESRSAITDSSIFTQILQSGLPDEETFIVHRGYECFAILNAFPYSPGHLLVLPYREVGELELLTDSERNEIWALVADAVRAVKLEYRPHGVNVGINMGASAGGSVAQHLHVHVVPRWGGDTNFMVTVANTSAVLAVMPLATQELPLRTMRPLEMDACTCSAGTPGTDSSMGFSTPRYSTFILVGEATSSGAITWYDTE
jgi:ATP adenylyltransferase